MRSKTVRSSDYGMPASCGNSTGGGCCLEIVGQYLQEQGNLPGAIECYQKAVKIKSYDAQAHLNLGSLYAINKQIPQAIAAYKKAISLQPNLPAAYRNLARVWTQEGKQEEANECTKIMQEAISKQSFLEQYLESVMKSVEYKKPSDNSD
ncbi:tetratricopeptide repeat protein [Candidatus Gracilibacteria bacterium]|nr:tetratricopeptide repeat protein [Candidatus Gracilibacteria bacterium]